LSTHAQPLPYGRGSVGESVGASISGLVDGLTGESVGEAISELVDGLTGESGGASNSELVDGLDGESVGAADRGFVGESGRADGIGASVEHGVVFDPHCSV
jgi:hypothetical protein